MIDLRSDTVTTPTEAMRKAARDAAVGDDVYGEDPTVNTLESTVADLLGKEAAVFVPSGTMGNQLALLVHTDPGQEVIVEEHSHLYNWEVGGLATNAGLVARPVDGGSSGLFAPEHIADHLVTESLHRAGTGLVCIENTHNQAGGMAHSADSVAALHAEVAAHDIPLHIDGARLFNAAVALDTTPARLAEPADTVMVCLSKGLGAPIGSVLAGPTALIEQARRERKRLGGGMRQVGIIAAPALEGVRNWERLAEDHRRAQRLAEGLSALDEVTVTSPETNILLLDIAHSGMSVSTFLESCADRGVQGVQFGETVVRFCTHFDISDADVEKAIDAVERVVT